MERTEFQQMMAELKEQNERRRYDALRKKYAIAPDFINMSLYDELGVRYDLDELEQLKQKFGVAPISNNASITCAIPQQPSEYGQTQTPWRKILENTQYINNTPKAVSKKDIMLEALNGFGYGIERGIERGINAISGGLYDGANDLFFDNGYEKRQKELLELAKQEGLEKPCKYANYIIDIACSNFPMAKVGKHARNFIKRNDNKQKNSF